MAVTASRAHAVRLDRPRPSRANVASRRACRASQAHRRPSPDHSPQSDMETAPSSARMERSADSGQSGSLRLTHGRLSGRGMVRAARSPMAVTREPSPTGLSRGVERRVEPVEPSGPLSFSAIVASRPARRAFTAARPQPSRSGEPRSRLSAANVARHGLPSAALGPPSIRRTHSRT
jgi:hypothetical protein